MRSDGTSRPIFDGLRPAFLAALVALILSKGVALLPGLAPDDYVRILEHTPANFFLAQGRFTEALVFSLVRRFGLSIHDVWWASLALLLPVTAAAIAAAVRLAAPAPTPLAWLCVAAGLAGSMAVGADILLFRTAIPVHSVCWLAFLVFLTAAYLPWSWRRRTAAQAVAVAVALGGYQPMLGLFLAVALADLARIPGGWRERLASSVLPAFVLGVCLYIFIAVGLGVVFGVGSNINDRGGAITVGDLPARAALLMRHLLEPFGQRDPATAALAFPLLALFVSAVLLLAAWRAPGRAAWGVAILLAVSGAVLLPLMLLKVVWMPGRTMIAGVFAACLVAAMLAAVLPRAGHVPLLALGVLASAAQAVGSSRILLDQQRANRWEMARAAAIAQDVLAAHGGRRPSLVVLVNHGWELVPRHRPNWYDRNTTSLAIPYSASGVFHEATGMVWQVRTARGLEPCRTSPAWPEQGAIHPRADATLVCFGPGD